MAFGGIEILARLSTGGMGEVLLGRRKGALGFEKLLAIKTIRGDLVERADFRAMFLDEARLVARLDHPTICQVYDFGEEGKLLFITMEYVAGVSLSQLLRAGRAPLPPGVAARLMAEVARGLHYAHEAVDNSGQPLGVVHRDVSPQNLLLTFDGRMKILDFGIAITKDREAPDTAVGVLKGKPSYMAPEHLRGGVVDRRADIFSCGVVLHEIITGKKLFTRETALATALAVESDPIDPPSKTIPDLLPDLDAIVMRCLSRTPGERYSDAKALAEALEHAAHEIDAVSVQEYASTELGEQRSLHQTWLNEVLDKAEHGGAIESAALPTSAPGAFPTDSLPGPPPEARPITPPAMEAKALAGAGVLRGEETTAMPTIALRRGRKTPAAISVALGLLLAIGGAVYFTSSEAPTTAKAEVEALPIPPPVPHVQIAVSSATIALAVEEDEAPPQQERRAEREERSHVQKRRPKPQKEAPAAEPKEVEPVTGGFGWLTVGATPFALVRIDGADAGATPFFRKKLPAGVHEIELLSPDTGEVRLKKKIRLGPEEHEQIKIP